MGEKFCFCEDYNNGDPHHIFIKESNTSYIERDSPVRYEISLEQEVIPLDFC